jgi:serine/threonine protein kinase/tetratricopeptide (TPR) repeat protein
VNPPGQTIDPELWERVSSIFWDALDIPADQRDAFLNAACDGSPALDEEVRRLLQEHASADGFLEDPATTEPVGGEAANAGRVCRTGDVLSHRFRIVNLLGAGGMGEVYEAFDSELRQTVAIKTLRGSYACDPGMVERFRSEVLRSRQITHPNVARVYDLFTHRREDGSEIAFFTMELLEGEPLSRWLDSHGPLTPDGALPIIQQMSAALQAAHNAGIIHRDFKPGNVFLSQRPESPPKATVTDFGIAVQLGTIAEPAGGGSVPSGMSLLAGTPAYMAPERLLGGACTPAVDVYALGLVAHEMVTGQPVYNAKSPLACALKKVEGGEPELSDGCGDLPQRWVDAIRRAVRTDPEERFTDPVEFVDALTGTSIPAEGAGTRNRWQSGILWAFAASFVTLFAIVAFLATRPAREAAPHSLAVLPFENSGRDSVSAYLSDGIAEGLNRSLGAFPKLRMIPQTTAAAFRDQRKAPAQISKELGVEMLLTGSFRESGHHLQLTAELLDGGGKILWNKPYDCDMEQLLDVQDDVTRHVASRLALGAPLPQSKTVPTTNAEAYDLFLRARYLWGTRTREGVMKAIEYFERAVFLDGNFAIAHAGIADAYIVLADYGWSAPEDVEPKARAALDRAVALDEDAAETQASLGLFNTLIAWDQVAAERAFQRAIAHDPSLASAHHWYANYLERSRRMDEALREAQEARRLDPATPPTLLIMGWIRYYRREYPAAIEIGKQAIELYPTVPQGHDLLALSYAVSGQADLALRESSEAVRLTSDVAVALRRRAVVLSRIPGHQDEARKLASKLETMSSDRQAAYLVPIYAALRDRDRMYRWADRAIEIHDPYLLMANVDLPLDLYRSEPRFQQILRRMGY